MRTTQPGLAALPRGPRRSIRAAAWLLLIQGVLMEASAFLLLIVLLVAGLSPTDFSEHSSFIVPFFNEHLSLMMAISGVFAALRIMGAVGLLRGRAWGYALSLITCTVTLVLMIFMLPAGLADGVLSGTALVLLLVARYGIAPIEVASDLHYAQHTRLGVIDEHSDQER